jgi:predicted GNAT family acetyltransferase
LASAKALWHKNTKTHKANRYEIISFYSFTKIHHMLIQNSETGNRGIFFVETDNEKLAELDYSLAPGLLIINHTEVDEKLKGKNVGYQLVNHAANYAREKNLKIMAYCPFAKAIFEKRKAEFSDVLKQ